MPYSAEFSQIYELCERMLMDVNGIASELRQCKAEIKKVGLKIEGQKEEMKEYLNEMFRRQNSNFRKMVKPNLEE